MYSCFAIIPTNSTILETPIIGQPLEFKTSETINTNGISKSVNGNCAEALTFYCKLFTVYTFIYTFQIAVPKADPIRKGVNSAWIIMIINKLVIATGRHEHMPEGLGTDGS